MKIKLWILSLSFFLFPFSLQAQSSDQLRQDVAALKTSVQNSNQKLADALNLLTTMQQEFASIKGVTESGGHFYEEQNRSLREYDQRLSAMEDKLNILTNLLKDIKDKNVSAGIPDKIGGADLGQTQEFQKLLDYVNSEDWHKALSGFQSFLQKYPRSPLADNAQFWIGEAFYGLGDYKKSISEYQMLIQKYPKSPKAKNALLKQGFSFFNLKMYSEAKPFLEKVMAEYPSSSEAARASAKIKEIDKLLASNQQSATPVAPSSLAPVTPNTNAPQINPSPAPPSSPPTATAPQSPGVSTYPQPAPPSKPPISGGF